MAVTNADGTDSARLPAAKVHRAGADARSYECRYPENARVAFEQDSAILSAMLDSLLDGVIAIRVDGIIALFNPAAEHIFVYSADEVVGRHLTMLMPEPHKSNHDEYVSNYLQTGVRKVIGSGREVTGLRSNGEEFAMELAVSEIPGSKEPMFVGIVRDVSERRATERELSFNHEMLDSISTIQSHFILDGNTAASPKVTRPCTDSSAYLFTSGRALTAWSGVANRPGGYDQELIEFLSPLIATCRNLVGALESERPRQAAQLALREASDRLNSSLEEVRKQNREITLLSELDELLQSCDTREEAAEVVAHLSKRLFPSFSGALYAMKDETGALELSMAWGDLPAMPKFPVAHCVGMRRGRPHVSVSDVSPLRCRHIDTEHHESICIPLIGKSETFGALHLIRVHTNDKGISSHVSELAAATASCTARSATSSRLP